MHGIWSHMPTAVCSGCHLLAVPVISMVPIQHQPETKPFLPQFSFHRVPQNLQQPTMGFSKKHAKVLGSYISVRGAPWEV